MKIAILTSSRADYSIYFPLLKEFQKDTFFDLNIIAFGTHVSKKHGFTLDAIKNDGFKISYTLPNLLLEDAPSNIVNTMGKTMIEFGEIWSKEKYDLVFALGDRYEMFAAVASSVPFNISIAHIHGGETTLGAIDDCFRHAITLISKYHFTTTNQYKKRVVELKGSDTGVYNVGALSIDNLKALSLLSIKEFNEIFKIDLSKPSILITFHPETVSFEKNETYISELILALKEIKDYQLIITMPNADTMGNMIREKINVFIEETDNAIGVESFGTVGYLSCMKHCTFMLGNTSSGFVEAAFFPKYVINLGERQTGRLMTENIINCQIEKTAILNAINYFHKLQLPAEITVYGNGNTSLKIKEIIKQAFDKKFK
jgi:GDP/UDP-N,N'-diacetylbacillosamine 2-epimerase (hydrolysing)